MFFSLGYYYPGIRFQHPSTALWNQAAQTVNHLGAQTVNHLGAQTVNHPGAQTINYLGAQTVNHLGAQTGKSVAVVCDPSEDGFVRFVAHPYECNKYFMCQGSTGILMVCPGNLNFDPSLSVCNFNWAHKCENKPYPGHPEEVDEIDQSEQIDVTEEPEESEETTINPNSDDYFNE